MQVAERRRALLVGAVIAVAVAWPGVSALTGVGDRDGFPLSTYPMFAEDRGRTVEVAAVVAVERDGHIRRLDPETIARTDQVIQAMVTVERAIAAGPGAAAALCADVAGRIGGDAAAVEVVVERFDSIRWAAGARVPLDRRVVASCEVPR